MSCGSVEDGYGRHYSVAQAFDIFVTTTVLPLLGMAALDWAITYFGIGG